MGKRKSSPRLATTSVDAVKIIMTYLKPFILYTEKNVALKIK